MSAARTHSRLCYFSRDLRGALQEKRKHRDQQKLRAVYRPPASKATRTSRHRIFDQPRFNRHKRAPSETYKKSNTQKRMRENYSRKAASYLTVSRACALPYPITAPSKQEVLDVSSMKAAADHSRFYRYRARRDVYICNIPLILF